MSRLPGTGGGRFFRAVLIVFGLLAGSAFPSPQPWAPEHSVKASFIPRFISFIRWPAPLPGTADSGAPFLISILGDDPFHGDLMDAFRDAKLSGMEVRIKVARSVDDLAGSKVVILPAESRDQVVAASRWAAEHGALTIGDGEGFGTRGVIINFFRQDDKVRFEINPRAAERSRLQVSSLLLKVARIVKEPG